MKLQQLRYLVEIVDQHFNVTEAANQLYTSQPGISKQIRQLEQELGLAIFERHGKTFQGLTPAGQKILAISRELLVKAEGIKSVATEYTHPDHGVLRIATSNTQACYFLPSIIEHFHQRYPKVSIHLHQGSPSQINEALLSGEVDFAIITEAQELFENVMLLPCYCWNRSVVVKPDHPLANGEPLTIENLGRYPLLTYTFGFTGQSNLDYAFNGAGILPNIVFSATDAYTIKTYVRLGLGAGIIATMAYSEKDDDLVALDASHLFQANKTQIAIKKGTFLRSYMYDFINYVAPHLTKSKVEEAEMLRDNMEVKKLFSDIEFPCE